jgi:hypothetical protein
MQKFFTGDRVRYVGKSEVWTKDEAMIIHEAIHQGGGVFEYSTTSGAWFEDDDFVLVSRADEESLAQLEEVLAEEDEE